MWAYGSCDTWVLVWTEAKSHVGQIIENIEFIEIIENFGIIEIIDIIDIIDFMENFVTPIERRWRDQTTKREVYSKLTLQPVRAVSNE